MDIPMKYEDVVAKLDATLAERDRFREQLSMLERYTGVYIPRGQELHKSDFSLLFETIQKSESSTGELNLPDLRGQRAENLSVFSKEMIDAAFEGGSLDGAEIQDIAVKHGLLKIENRTEECGDVCACREFGFPSECYRKTDLIALKPAAECEHSFHYFGTEQNRRRCNWCNKLEAEEGEGS